MMGPHHAITGAAVWLAMTEAAGSFPALGFIHSTPIEASLGSLVAAGAALLPDADHPQATIAHSAGIVSKAATAAVGASAGGHRHGTHAPLVAAGVVALCWWATAAGWVTHGWVGAHPWALGIIVAVLLTWATKTMKLVRGWAMAWVTGVIVAGLVTLLAPGVFLLLPTMIAVGWVTHLAGDFLTVGGLPWSWPFGVKPKRDWGPFLSKGGYAALPILGTAGSIREWLLCVPVTGYVLWGIGANVVGITEQIQRAL